MFGGGLGGLPGLIFFIIHWSSVILASFPHLGPDHLEDFAALVESLRSEDGGGIDFHMFLLILESLPDLGPISFSMISLPLLESLRSEDGGGLGGMFGGVLGGLPGLNCFSNYLYRFLDSLDLYQT